MANTFNQGIVAALQSPVDVKSIVGNLTTYPMLTFATKEEIPEWQRYVGMQVYDLNDGIVYVLSEGVENTNYKAFTDYLDETVGVRIKIINTIPEVQVFNNQTEQWSAVAIDGGQY